MPFSRGAAHAATVSFEWDPNSDGDLAGYTIFQSSGSLLALTTAQALTNPTIVTHAVSAAADQYTLANLLPDTSYYFRLAAYTTTGVYSGFNVTQSSAPSQVIFYQPSAPTSSSTTDGDSEAASARAPQTFLSPVPADGMNDTMQFGPAAREVTIFDLRGREYFHAVAAGGSPIAWNCRAGDGAVVPAGAYIARIRTGSGRIVFQKCAIIK